MLKATTQMICMANATTTEEVWEIATRFLEAHGFCRVAYGASHLGRDEKFSDPRNFTYMTNYNSGDNKANFSLEKHRHTATYRWLMNNIGAVSWGWSQNEYREGRLHGQELEAHEEAVKIGLSAGYSISFADVSPRYRAAVSLGASQDCTQDDVDAYWRVHGADIQAFCHMLHLKFRSMPNPTERRPLSPRQREVLQWVAEGKTMQDTAMIMGISPAMVEKHLRLAREALDVETTAHAIARATMLNELFNTTAGTHAPKRHD